MDNVQNKINIVYHLTQLYENLSSLSDIEFKDLISTPEIKKIMESERMSIFNKNLTIKNKKNNIPFEQFRFEYIMNRLRNIVLHSSSETDSAADIEWLLRILLVSPELFPSVRELDNFLVNMTGTRHNTRSTGRDRIVDWYLKAILDMRHEEQNKIFHKIAKYIFIKIPSNYKEWNKILSKEGKKS